MGHRINKKLKTVYESVYLFIMFLFLYLPVVVLMVY